MAVMVAFGSVVVEEVGTDGDDSVGKGASTTVANASKAPHTSCTLGLLALLFVLPSTAAVVAINEKRCCCCCCCE